jgi:putative aldouronate transport system substrate-binding protein
MGAPTETMKSKWDILWQAELETFSKIIYGQIGLDEFDNFVEKWKQNGGEKVTEEVNAWYDSVK